MGDVYKNCPIYENENYILRMIRQEDKTDLLKVYSDEKAVPFLNSDNCGGDDFHYTTENRMEQAIASATERIIALNDLGFELSDEKLVGHDGTKYDSYFVLKKNY